MISITRSMLKALLAALITAAVLVFILAFAAYKSADPRKLLGVFGIIALFVSAFAGGFTAKRETAGVAGSIIFAVLYILVCLAVSLIMGNKPAALNLLISYLGLMGSALIGGICAGGGKRKKPKSLKKYKTALKKGKKTQS